MICYYNHLNFVSFKYLGSTDPCHGGSIVEIVFESEESSGFMLKTPGDGDLSTFSVEPTPPMVQITPASPGLSIPSLNIIPSTPTRSRSPAPDSITEEGVEHEDEGGDLEQQPGPETQESVQSEKTKEYLVDIAAEVKHEPLVQKEESLTEQVSESVLEAEVVESKPEVDLNESKPKAEIVESESVAEIVEPESEAEKTESNPEAEIVESKSETDVNESKPEAEVIESTPETEIVESKPETEVVESKSEAEIIEPNPAATSETSTPEVESKSDESESTPKAGITKTKVEPTAKGGRTAAAARTKPGAAVPSRTGKDLDKTKL